MNAEETSVSMTSPLVSVWLLHDRGVTVQDAVSLLKHARMAKRTVSFYIYSSSSKVSKPVLNTNGVWQDKQRSEKAKKAQQNTRTHGLLRRNSRPCWRQKPAQTTRMRMRMHACVHNVLVHAMQCRNEAQATMWRSRSAFQCTICSACIPLCVQMDCTTQA